MQQVASSPFPCTVPRTARVGLRCAAPGRRSAVSQQAAAAAAAAAEPGSKVNAALYFVAMNNFQVKPDSRDAFEKVWKSRESKLHETPGFIRFNLLRGDSDGEYISESVWASRKDFEAWTQSSNFQKAHSNQSDASKGPAAKGPAGSKTAGMLEGPPRPKFYEAVTVTEQTLF